MASTSVTFDILARDRASSTFKNVGDSANKSSSHIAAFGAVMKKAALGVGLLTTAAAVFTFKVGSAYVDSLNKIQALTGATDKQMRMAADSLEKNAGLYAKMGQTSGDAAAGVVELTKSGLSLDDALKSVYGTMTLAKAGEMEVADAAAVTANALNTFHLKASAAGKVANYLANAANISSADVSDLAESLKYVAPVAASAGVSIKQTNAVLAELANAGIKGSQAGTALRTFLLNLQAPTAAAAKEMEALNVQIYDSAGKMKPLNDVVGILSSKINGLSDERASVALKNLFGKTGIAGATTILNEGTKGLKKYTDGIDRAGAASKLAESKSKGLAGSFNIIKASAISGAQSMYRQFSPILDKVVRPLAEGFAGFASGMGPKLQAGLDKIKGALGKFDITGIGKDLAKQAKTWAAPVIDGFKKGLNTGDWSGLGKALGMGISTAFGSFGSVAGKIGDALGDVDWVGLGLKVGKKAVPFLVGFAAGMLNPDGLGDIAKHWKDILFGVIAIALPGEGLATKIGAQLLKVPFAGKLLSWGFLALNKFSRGMVGKVFDALKFIGKAFLEGIRKVFPKVGKSFEEGLSLLPDTIRTVAKYVVVRAKEMMRGLGNAITRGIGSVVRAIGQLIANIVKPFAGAAGWLVKKGAEILGGLLRGITSKVSDALAPLRALGGKIKSAAGNLGSVLYGAGQAVIEGLWNGISSKLSWLGSKLGGVGSFIKSHKGPIEKDRELLRPAGRAIMDGLIKGIADRKLPLQAALAQVTDIVAKAKDQIDNAMGKVSNLQGVRSGFAGTFTADSIFGTDGTVTTQDAEGNDVTRRSTVADLIAFQKKEANQAHRLARDIKDVTRRGLSKSLVKQLQSQGAEGAAALHEIAQGSRKDIARLNRLNKQTSDSLHAAGMRAGNAVRGGSIDKDIRIAQRQVRSIEKQEHILEQLEHHLREIAHSQKKDQTIVVEIDGEAAIRSIVRRNKRKGVKSAGI